MNSSRKRRITSAREKLASQLAADDGSRVLCLLLQTRAGLTFSTTLEYHGPITARLLQAAESAIEELDFKISAASHALQSLAVEQNVPKPPPISLDSDLCPHSI